MLPVDAGMGTFAASVQSVNGGLAVQIHMDAPHQIMLAGEDRDPVFCDVHPFLQAPAVDGGKAVLQIV